MGDRRDRGDRGDIEKRLRIDGRHRRQWMIGETEGDKRD